MCDYSGKLKKCHQMIAAEKTIAFSNNTQEILRSLAVIENHIGKVMQKTPKENPLIRSV